MAKLGEIKGVDASVASALLQNRDWPGGITSTGDLWELLQAHRGKSLRQVADLLGVSPAVLASLLTADACDEIRRRGSLLWPRNLAHELRRLWRRRRGFWPDAALAAALLTLFALGGYAYQGRARPDSSPWWQPVVVAARDLDAGSVIKDGDVEVRLRAPARDTLTDVKPVVGHQPRRPLKRGELVLAGNLSPSLNLSEQIVVKAAGGLPAFHVISPEDVEVKQAPQESDSFQKAEDIVGHYLLEAAPPNSTLRRGQLSAACLSADDLKDRYLVSLPVKAGNVSPGLTPGGRITLLFSAREGGAQPPPPVDDVILLAANQSVETVTLVVGVRWEVWPAVIKQVGLTDVFVSQPILR
ncbi:MAG: SAF domain-containing protein [Acidobacteriota bacterium]|nr:SAF domain-containing protein [Acidobacteriota bacterium]